MRRTPALVAVGLVLIAAAPKETRMEEAHGRFDVTMTPQPAGEAPLGRMAMAKRYHGDLEGTAAGEMLSAGSPATGSAGYVALEVITGALKGRAGTFAVQQSGTMDGGRREMIVNISPGSGTGALAGITGTMTIDTAAGHAYVLRYSLPAGG